MPLKPFDKHSSKADAQGRSIPRREFVYRMLRDAILDGRLVTGERMREVALAEQLGVSRTPIREALGRLETEGLLTLDDERGMIVTELNLEMVNELYVMREVLEGAAAALAARHATAVELATLRTLADRDERFVGHPLRLSQNNRLFHQTLYRCAHNRYLFKMLSSLQESIALLGPTGLGTDDRARDSVNEHQRLVVALEAHDARGAEDIARAHIRDALKARLAIIDKRVGF